ncbi:MAG: DEAD/DEAH box helicase, partial [Patescibacteria group bacterium]|nr:DEAD/DEAH box helicase [Patescibacteria group bacterium]
MNHELFELNAHHLFPKKLDGKNTIKNGIVFCRGCHAALHPEHYSFFKKIFRFFRDHIIEKILFINKNNSYYRVLEFLTGSSTFRNYQLKSIKIIYEEKKNVFFVSPTGSGKSIIFQIPAIIDFLKSFEPTLVLESLNALQKDQVKNLLNRLIPATYINSDLSKNEIYERIMGLKNKE